MPIGRDGDEMIRCSAYCLAVSTCLIRRASLRISGGSTASTARCGDVADAVMIVFGPTGSWNPRSRCCSATRIADLARRVAGAPVSCRSSRARRAMLAGTIPRWTLIANLVGREALWPRFDFHWAARRPRESSEQIESLDGERWRNLRRRHAKEKAGNHRSRAVIGRIVIRRRHRPLALKEKISGEAGRRGRPDHVPLSGNELAAELQCPTSP